MAKADPKDLALVLPGGGAWIFAQAAALQVLFQEKALARSVRGIYANSAGAISGTCLAKGLHDGVGTAVLATALQSVVRDTQIYRPDLVRVLEHPITHALTIARLLWGLAFGESALRQDPLWDLLHKTLGDLTTAEVRAKTGVEVLVRGFDSTRGLGRVFDGSLWHMAAASSAIECAFRPHLGISDGGPFDNCPVDLALARGFRRILIVYCGPAGPPMDPQACTLSDSTPHPPRIRARHVAARLLGNVTSLNESLNSARLALWKSRPGNQLVEACPAAGTDMGSFLDFSAAAQAPRKAAGEAAGRQALAKARDLGWLPKMARSARTP